MWQGKTEWKINPFFRSSRLAEDCRRRSDGSVAVKLRRSRDANVLRSLWKTFKKKLLRKSAGTDFAQRNAKCHNTVRILKEAIGKLKLLTETPFWKTSQICLKDFYASMRWFFKHINIEEYRKSVMKTLFCIYVSPFRVSGNENQYNNPSWQQTIIKTENQTKFS